jgi:hypothetical protein
VRFMPTARVTGIALIALGIACWPSTPMMGMLAYSHRNAGAASAPSVVPCQPQIRVLPSALMR